MAATEGPAAKAAVRAGAVATEDATLGPRRSAWSEAGEGWVGAESGAPTTPRVTAGEAAPRSKAGIGEEQREAQDAGDRPATATRVRIGVTEGSSRSVSKRVDEKRVAVRRESYTARMIAIEKVILGQRMETGGEWTEASVEGSERRSEERTHVG